jgi:hypothetical protein
MRLKELNKFVIPAMVLLMLALPVLADSTNITSGKDLIGNPYQTFNGLPDSVKGGVKLILGIAAIGALVAIAIGILVAVGKISVGKTTQNAKMGHDGVTTIIIIVGTVILAMIALGFVFWYFNPSSV